MTFHEALHTWELAQDQVDESRAEYLSAKNFGNATTMFTAAVVLAEAHCIEREAFDLYQATADEEMRAVIRAERAAAS
jgi:hypothetical protein